MFARKKNQRKTPRELFDTTGKDLINLIQQDDLDGIKLFMRSVAEAPSDILHLYDSDVRSIISHIIAKQNPEMCNYFFGLIYKEYEEKCTQKELSVTSLSGINDDEKNTSSPTDNEGYYLYHWALLLNQISWIKSIILEDSNINIATRERKYSSHYYALDLVCHHGSVDGLQFLLHQKKLSELEYEDDLILQGIRKGHLSIIKKLFETGVKLKRPNDNDKYYDYSGLALCEAARLNRTDIVTYLLNDYPDQSIHTQDVIKYAIRQALSEGHFYTTQLLLPHFEGQLKSLAEYVSFDQGRDKHKQVEELRFLLDHGIDPNTTTLYGSLLCKAASVRNLEAVNLLLSRGAIPVLNGIFDFMNHGPSVVDIEIVETIMNAMGKPTPKQLEEIVRYALSTENMAVLALLIKRGAQLNGSSLAIAIHQGKAILLSKLITDYANHFSNEDIKEATITVLKRGYIDAFETLYSQLNSVNVNDFAPHIHIEKQESPSLFIKNSASESSSSFLTPINYNGFTGLYKNENQARVDFQQCLQFLLAKGLNPNIIFADNTTLLGKAAKANNIDACRALLLAGANPNLAQATPPLVFAVNQRHPQLTSLLLEYGAEIGEALPLARKCRYANIANILERHQQKNSDQMQVDAETIESNHYYIYCGVSMLSIMGGGIFNHCFSMLATEPLLLNNLPNGFTANCSFSALKDIIPALGQYQSLPEGLVDMGIDKNNVPAEMIEFDFYYDCEGLDKATVLKAIKRLKEKYLANQSERTSQSTFDDSESQEDMEAKIMFDPVTIITKILLQIIKPTSSAIAKEKRSIFQPVQYDSAESNSDFEPMSDNEPYFASAESGDEKDSNEESPLLKRRKF